MADAKKTPRKVIITCAVTGSRACKCNIAAPASAAATASSAICCGVMGKYGDIEGVWIAPVTAQVMMTLRGVFFASAMPRQAFAAG